MLSNKLLIPLYLRWVHRFKSRSRGGEHGMARRALAIVRARHPRFR